MNHPQQATRVRKGPTFWGLAECNNLVCEADLRPIKMATTTLERLAYDLPGVVTGSSEHDNVLDDADLTCPECGRPCAILRQPPSVIPSYGYGS